MFWNRGMSSTIGVCLSRRKNRGTLSVTFAGDFFFDHVFPWSHLLLLTKHMFHMRHSREFHNYLDIVLLTSQTHTQGTHIWHEPYLPQPLWATYIPTRVSVTCLVPASSQYITSTCFTVRSNFLSGVLTLARDRNFYPQNYVNMFWQGNAVFFKTNLIQTSWNNHNFMCVILERYT